MDSCDFPLGANNYLIPSRKKDGYDMGRTAKDGRASKSLSPIRANSTRKRRSVMEGL